MFRDYKTVIGRLKVGAKECFYSLETKHGGLVVVKKIVN